jgi:DNA-binding NarL/FixJ family response regulator
MSGQDAHERRPGESLRVSIVDDHVLFRAGLRNLLEEQDIHVVGEAAGGGEAVRIVRELAPDVVLIDLNIPGMGGLEATRRITAISPLTRVLVLTTSDEDRDVREAMLAGACGYLLKDSSVKELMKGIHAASKGESFISPRLIANGKDNAQIVAERRISPKTVVAELVLLFAAVVVGLILIFRWLS